MVRRWAISQPATEPADYYRYPVPHRLQRLRCPLLPYRRTYPAPAPLYRIRLYLRYRRYSVASRRYADRFRDPPPYPRSRPSLRNPYPVSSLGRPASAPLAIRAPTVASPDPVRRLHPTDWVPAPSSVRSSVLVASVQVEAPAAGAVAPAVTVAAVCGVAAADAAAAAAPAAAPSRVRILVEIADRPLPSPAAAAAGVAAAWRAAAVVDVVVRASAAALPAPSLVHDVEGDVGVAAASAVGAEERTGTPPDLHLMQAAADPYYALN